MDILQTFTATSWQEKFSESLQAQTINAVENGGLLFFPQLAFSLKPEERRFLSPTYVDPKRKNISYDKHTGELRGARVTPAEYQPLKNMLARFANQACDLIIALFPHYQNNLKIARTSYRPAQVSQRKMSYRKDDKRLHIDAFPSNPNQGQRILRVFSNINPHGEDRVWRVGEPFEQVAKHFLPRIRKPLPGSAHLLKLLGITKSYRTPYDHYMLQIHDRMKGDEAYQSNAQQIEIRLPPNTSWIVCTDQVSHAAMSGQYLLEQTFYLPVHAMLDESCSPLRILERLTGRALVS
jgi:hypothetical protein